MGLLYLLLPSGTGKALEWKSELGAEMSRNEQKTKQNSDIPRNLIWTTTKEVTRDNTNTKFHLLRVESSLKTCFDSQHVSAYTWGRKQRKGATRSLCSFLSIGSRGD
jgi:hypothetical protein